jgi:hypothetical protein
MIEGSGARSGSVPRTNGSGSGRPKKRQIRIHKILPLEFQNGVPPEQGAALAGGGEAGHVRDGDAGNLAGDGRRDGHHRRQAAHHNLLARRGLRLAAQADLVPEGRGVGDGRHASQADLLMGGRRGRPRGGQRRQADLLVGGHGGGEGGDADLLRGGGEGGEEVVVLVLQPHQLYRLRAGHARARHVLDNDVTLKYVVGSSR